MPRARAAVVAALALAVLTSGTAASASQRSAPAALSGANGAFAAVDPAGVAAKKKPVKCKGGKVPVKLGKKQLCRPLRSVFPPPAKVDPRFAFLKAAMDFKPPAPKGKQGKGKGRRPGSLKQGFGGAGRKAYREILAALPKLLAQVDAAAPGRAPVYSAARANASRAAAQASERSAAAATGCPDTPSQTSQIGEGGVNMAVTFTGLGASMVITFSVGGRDFRIEYETSEGCGDFAVPKCPTASGQADAQRTKSDRALIQVRAGGQLVSSQSTSARRVTKTQGQTAADALLDYVDVQDSIRMDVGVNGQTVRGVLNRSTRIDMRSGTYVPSQSSASFAGAQALQNLDRGGFAALANGVIYRYRSAESGPETIVGPPGWAVYERSNEGTYCVRAEFDPATNTLKVRKQQPRAISGRILVSGGGQASDGRWQTYETQNGIFDTPNPQGASVTINFRATQGEDGELVIGRYKVSSTAGVTKSSWNAEIEDVPTIEEIAGSFSGTYQIATILGPSLLSFSGNLEFHRLTPAVFGGADGFYTQQPSSFTVTASGIDFSGITGCSQSGTGSFTIPADQGTMVVNGTGSSLEPPYDYSFSVGATPSQTLAVTRHSCPAGAEDWEDTTFSQFVPPSFTTLESHVSDDGIAYADSESNLAGGSGTTLNWNLTGTEE